MTSNAASKTAASKTAARRSTALLAALAAGVVLALAAAPAEAGPRDSAKSSTTAIDFSNLHRDFGQEARSRTGFVGTGYGGYRGYIGAYNDYTPGSLGYGSLQAYKYR